MTNRSEQFACYDRVSQKTDSEKEKERERGREVTSRPGRMKELEREERDGLVVV